MQEWTRTTCVLLIDWQYKQGGLQNTLMSTWWGLLW